MSEFTNNKKIRIENLTQYMIGLIKKENGAQLVEKYKMLTANYVPADVLPVFDNLFNMKFNIRDIKEASNKLFNILYKSFTQYKALLLQQDTFLYYLHLDNIEADKLLQEIRPLNREINKNITKDNIENLQIKLNKLSKIIFHYTIIENILFPLLEKSWPHHQCLKLLWSYHDDVRRNFKKITEVFENNKFDINKFNEAAAELYFDIYTIIFREDRVLFPVTLETINQDVLPELLEESFKFDFAFVQPQKKVEKKSDKNKIPDENKNSKMLISFPTGNLTIKEIEEIFNHLPVDITFVDKDNIVKFFSNSEHRIFPRTKSIIGRKVQNCHPHESVEVVNKIIDSFKSGEKNEASFWIHLADQYILIRYFAIRDEKKKFMGILEVSQEISEIQHLSGEKKLLNWE